MKGIFVIMDGVADKPCQVLGNITPLQAAKTPNLDALAKKGKLDYCYTVKEGYSPESDAGVISLLGYDFVFEQRGPLEALLPFPFEFIPTIQHRAVLVIRGGFSDNISNVDVDKKGKLAFSHSEDDDDESAELSAEVLNSFIRQSHKILDDHAINLVRSRKGFYSANAILCRGAGSKVPRFKKLKGRWMGLGYMPLEKGIAKATGMESYNFRYPKLKGIDAYANLYDGLKAATKYAGRMISWYKKKQDYFYVHFKECDLPGHDNKPLDKVKMIEMIDEGFFSYVRKLVEKDEKLKLIVTADHSTPCVNKGHSADPVPVLSLPGKDGKEKEQRFTEEQGMEGKKILGRKLLAEKFFGK